VINRVAVGMEVSIEVSSLNKNFEGRVFEVSPVVDSNSATYPVKIEIINASEEVKPGMASSVTFDFGSGQETIDNSLIVPVKAVGEDGSGNYVFIIESEDGKTGTVKKKVIEIGELTANGFKINSGLQGGEKIATAGLQTLLDGQKVKLQ